MKRALTAIIVLVSCFCTAQNSVWFPEKYVQAVQAKNPAPEEFLPPIEAIELQGKELFVIFSKGEWNTVAYTTTKIDGVDKMALQDLGGYVNLKYHSDDYRQQISETNFYISFESGKLVLEALFGDKKEKIYFVDRLEDYVFNHVHKSREYLIKL